MIHRHIGIRHVLYKLYLRRAKEKKTRQRNHFNAFKKFEDSLVTDSTVGTVSTQCYSFVAFWCSIRAMVKQKSLLRVAFCPSQFELYDGCVYMKYNIFFSPIRGFDKIMT